MSTTDPPHPRPAESQPTDRLATAEAPAGTTEPVPAATTGGRKRVLLIVAIAVGALLTLALTFGGGFAAGSLVSRFGGPGTAGGPGFDRPGGPGPGFGDRD